MRISIDQAVQYAQAAGFSGNALATIVAIAQAESGLDTAAVNPNDPNGGSFGILQINGIHTNISRSAMFDPAASFRYAYTLSKNGTDFHDWSTYNAGSQPGGYKTTAAWAQLSGNTNGAGFAGGVVNGAVGVLVPWSPQKSLKTWPWITLDGITPNLNNPYMSSFEASRGSTQPGVGVPTPFHTPITSLTSGHVIRAFYGTDINASYTYGGVVLVGTTIPGHPGTQAVFYLHLDQVSVKAGDVVTVGQEIGLSGGQNSGGAHPVSTTFSTGPHTDVGINNSNFAAEGGAPGPNFDPTPWLNDLIRNGPAPGDQIAGAFGTAPAATLAYVTAVSNQIASGTGPVADNFAAIEDRIDASMQFAPIDWSTISKGTSWWNYILPWQWLQTADTLTSNIAAAIYHDVSALMLRALVLIIGFVIVVAFVTSLFRSLDDASSGTLSAPARGAAAAAPIIAAAAV